MYIHRYYLIVCARLVLNQAAWASFTLRFPNFSVLKVNKKLSLHTDVYQSPKIKNV